MLKRVSHALSVLTVASTSFALAAQQPATPTAANQPQQQADGTYVLHRNARLVVLDVVVTDAKGNIVHGLKREDFTVTEANEPETIQRFEESDTRTPDSQATINSTTDLDHVAPGAPVNIVLLDEFNTRFEDMAFARYSLKKFLEKQPDKLTVPTELVAVNLQHFTVVHDYTQNKQDLINALDKHLVTYPWQAHEGQWLAERYGTAFEALRAVALATEGHPGHKTMIWIGRGFPALIMANVPVDAATQIDSYVQQCVNTLRDARITLYTVDPAGIQFDPMATYGPDAAFNDPFGGNYQFAKLATATGGSALYGRDDVDAEIGTAVRDGDSFYTLSYRPSDDSLDPSKFRRIRITLDKPGLTATTREGYYLSGGPLRVNPTNPSRRLVADLMSADQTSMVYDGVQMTLVPSDTDPNSFIVKIDPHSLGWTYATDTEPRHTEVILVVSTFDKKGKELKRVGKTITVAAPKTVPPTGRLERGVDLHYTVDPDPKAVRARFVVRVTASGRIGTADANLTQSRVAASPAASPQPN
jgi:VWFA-related protein